MADTTARTPENVCVLTEDVWFKLGGEVFVGKWKRENGELSIRNIVKTPYNEVPFVVVNIGR